MSFQRFLVLSLAALLACVSAPARAADPFGPSDEEDRVAIEALALYPEDARAIRASRTPEDEKTCTMCGDFCASRGAGKLFAGDLRGDKV